MCALLTYYDMNRRKAGHTDPWQLQALRIVKTRTKNGIPSFEIEWEKPEHFATADDQSVEPFLITIEESSLFQAAYPEIVALYQMEKLEICKEKKKGKKAKLKKKEDLAADGEVADLLSRLDLQSSCEILPDHNPKYDFKPDRQVLPNPNSKSQVPFVSPAKDLDNCQMSVKNSLKSVCQSGYSSSEDSDGGNVQVGRKASRGPQWQKKCSLVQLKDKCRVKRSDSKSELEIKRKGKISGTDLLVEEHPKPASIAHVHSSPSPINVSCSHLQDGGREADVWAESPLPLSERLKLRL
ncbi:UNVERIFIED_CONTAM: hypothetical protein K2H54_032160 [Gekko kuhli]